MHLLIQRSQSPAMFFNQTIFKLWAKFELTPEENTLINKYQVSEGLLVEGKPGDVKRAAIRAVILTLLYFFISPFFFGTVIGLLGLRLQPAEVIGQVIAIGILIFFICWFLIYHQIREEIRVSDILSGRFFKCRSIVTLVEKEEEITKMAFLFRHILETMKNWGGREIIELKPYTLPTLQFVEKPR